MKALTAIAAPVVFIGLLLAGWETACRLLEVPSYFLPAPSAIGAALRDNFPLLARSGWNTLATALWALLAASIVASLLALAAGLSGLVEQAIHPLVITLSVTPIIAIAPIVTIWAGLEHPERAVVGAVVAEFGAGSGGSQGLAWRILEASNRLQTAKAFAALFVLAVMGAGLYALLQIAERRALVWWRGR